MNSFSVKASNSTFSQAVQAIITRTCICEFGFVKEIVAEGIIKVVVSVAEDSSDIRIMNCVHIVPSASSLMYDIKPKKGDKVIVFFPRRYDALMFQKEQQDIIINQNGKGQTLFTGVAMLVNQFRPDDYKNFITFDEGKMTINLAYNEDEDKNLFTLSTNEKGEFSLSSNDVKVDIKEDNSLSIDTSKAKISIDKDGNIELNSMGGKISLKNNTANLYTILDGILTILNSSLATQGSPAVHTVVPNQFTAQVTQLGNLMQ